MIKPGFAIITISDRSSKGLREDLSGPKLVECVTKENWLVEYASIVPDEIDIIVDALKNCLINPKIHIILTTGGTGFAPRDVTPEATKIVIEKNAPGIAEALRAESLKLTPHAMLSRGIAGISGNTLIINLPGSPKAVEENFIFLKPILQHAVDLLVGDPNSEAGHTKTIK